MRIFGVPAIGAGWERLQAPGGTERSCGSEEWEEPKLKDAGHQLAHESGPLHEPEKWPGVGQTTSSCQAHRGTRVGAFSRLVQRALADRQRQYQV